MCFFSPFMHTRVEENMRVQNYGLIKEATNFSLLKGSVRVCRMKVKNFHGFIKYEEVILTLKKKSAECEEVSWELILHVDS